MADIGFKLQKSVEKSLDNYQLWIYDCISPYLGQRILDAGCSIGNVTKHFLTKEFVFGIDVSKESISEIKKRFKGETNFKAQVTDLSQINFRQFKEYNFDTIVCINVLEHIKNDKKAIRSFNQILKKGGRLILLVPAFDFLYGTMDKIDRHYRRYTKKTLKRIFEGSGFSLKKQFYFNSFSILGWLINGKILKRGSISQSSFRIFDLLVPTFKKIESLIPIPIGLSIISVYEKTKEV